MLSFQVYILSLRYSYYSNLESKFQLLSVRLKFLDNFQMIEKSINNGNKLGFHMERLFKSQFRLGILFDLFQFSKPYFFIN